MRFKCFIQNINLAIIFNADGHICCRTKNVEGKEK